MRLFLSGLLWLIAAVTSGAHAEPIQGRLALVIGNGAYVNAPALPNPPNDARLIADTLKQLGFTVIEGIDVDKRTFDVRVREFAEALRTTETAVFFYAGHGLQVSGHNHLLPTDARLKSERDLTFETVRADQIQALMELERENKTNIVFLDACRDNPFARNLAASMGTRSAALGRGLAQVDSGVGTFVSFSTQPGNVALDGEGLNSPFTGALARHVRSPGLGLPAVMVEVRKDVLKATGGTQVPWDHSALIGDFFFSPAGAKPAPAAAAPTAAAQTAMAAPAEELALRPPQPKPPAVAALAPRSETARGCIVVGHALEGAVAVKAGSEFCPPAGADKAKVIDIRSYGVVYETNGQRRTTCKPGQLCTFDWIGAPMFTTRVTQGASPEQVSAEIIPRDR